MASSPSGVSMPEISIILSKIERQVPVTPDSSPSFRAFMPNFILWRTDSVMNMSESLNILSLPLETPSETRQNTNLSGVISFIGYATYSTPPLLNLKAFSFLNSSLSPISILRYEASVG